MRFFCFFCEPPPEYDTVVKLLLCLDVLCTAIITDIGSQVDQSKDPSLPPSGNAHAEAVGAGT
jgi:hypothetical protein